MDLVKLLQARGEKYDSCKIFEDIAVDMKISQHNSASPSTVIFGNLVKKFPEKLVNTAVSVKIFIDITKTPELYTTDGKKITQELWDKKMGTLTQKYSAIRGLKYEMLFYTKIVSMIVKNHLSPNFVTPIAYGFCSAKNLLQNYPQIVEKLLEKYKNPYVYEYLKFLNIGITITEKVGKNIFSISSFYEMYIHKKLSEEIFDLIIFQIVYAIAILQIYKSIHNDLHAGNVIVEERIKPMLFAFVIGKKRYVIQTRFIPYLFDWDTSYSELLGINRKLVGRRCEEFNVCNKFNEKSDLFTLLCTLKFGKYRELYPEKTLKFTRKNNNENIINIIISKDDYTKIDQQKPYTKNIYKMSSIKLRSLISDEKTRNLIPESITSLSFKLFPYYIQILPGFECRPVAIDEKFPTPIEFLTTYFDKFLDSKTHVSDDATFVFPSVKKVASIYLDPNIPSTRDKIQGKPRFQQIKRGLHILEKPKDFEG